MPISVDEGLGRQFAARREAFGLSRRELARRADVHPDTIADLESSGRGQVPAASSIATALSCRWHGQPVGATVADWLRGARADRHLSQAHAVLESGLSGPTIVGLEKGRGNLTSLRKLLSIYDIPLHLAPIGGVIPARRIKGQGWELIEGEARAQIGQLANHGRRFQSIVCDPPYAMGAASWDDEIAIDPAFWTLSRNVLFPGSYLLAFATPNRSHRVATALEQAGFVIRDRIIWLRQGVPWGAKDLSAQIDEHLGHEREIIGQQQSRGRVAASGADLAFRPMGFTGTKRSEVAISTEAATWSGWANRLKDAMEDIIVAQVPFRGRLAANVLAHGVGGLNIDGLRVAGKAAARREPGTGAMWQPNELGRWPSNVVLGDDAAPFSKYFHVAKPVGADRWGHPCAKHVKLLRGLVRLVSPPGSTVLDLFSGAASCGEAALREGLGYVGIELDPRHVENGRKRLNSIASRVSLEDGAPDVK